MNEPALSITRKGKTVAIQEHDTVVKLMDTYQWFYPVSYSEPGFINWVMDNYMEDEEVPVPYVSQYGVTNATF